MVLTLCFSIVRISEVINKENTEDNIRRGHSLQEGEEKELTNICLNKRRRRKILLNVNIYYIIINKNRK
jgi:hypothetical protein